MQRFQEGGLAEVMGPPDPLEEVMQTDTLDLAPMSITATDPPKGGIQELARMTRDDAIQRLRTSQQALAERRKKRERADESARWLALAEGMLAPTRTGAFGENIGMAAGNLRGELASAREAEEFYVSEEANMLAQEGVIESQYLDDLMRAQALEKQRTGEYGTRRPTGSPALYTHPENKDWLARGQAVWDPDKINEDGTTGGMDIEWLEERGADGSIPRAMHALDVERRGQLELITGITKGEVDRANDDISMGREAHDLIQPFERALYLLDRVGEGGPGTGGWVNLMQHMSEWLGDSSEVTADLGELRNLLGRQVLDGLKHFPGQISEGERKFMESLETALSKPEGVNRRLLETGIRRMNLRRDRGIRAARDYGQRRDLLAMGIDPDAPEAGQVPPGSQVQGGKGSSSDNPIDVVAGMPKPPVGSWVRLPNGTVTTVKK